MSYGSPKSLSPSEASAASPSEASAASPSPSSVSGPCVPDLYEYSGRLELYMNYEMDGASSHEGPITGDGFVWANEGILRVGVHVAGGGSHQMQLYQADLAFVTSDLYAKYEADEADFSGYTKVSGGFVLDDSLALDADDWAYRSTAIAPLGNPGDQIHNGGAVDNATIYGCYMLAQHNADPIVQGVIVGDWNNGGLSPATNPFPMNCFQDEIECEIIHAASRPSSATSGNMGVSDAGERHFLHRMPGHYAGGMEVRVRLFTGAHTPGETDVLADYTDIEADFSGYPVSGLVAWDTNARYTELTVAGKAQSDSDLAPKFEHNLFTTDNDVTGYFLTIYYPAPLYLTFLIGGERFTDAVEMDANEKFIEIPMKDFLWNANQ